MDHLLEMGGGAQGPVRALSKGSGLYAGPALTLTPGSHYAGRGAQGSQILGFSKESRKSVFLCAISWFLNTGI